MAEADGVNVGALQLPSVYGRGVSRHIMTAFLQEADSLGVGADVWERSLEINT